jgi:hypothetical protein
MPRSRHVRSRFAEYTIFEFDGLSPHPLDKPQSDRLHERSQEEEVRYLQHRPLWSARSGSFSFCPRSSARAWMHSRGCTFPQTRASHLPIYVSKDFGRLSTIRLIPLPRL